MSRNAARSSLVAIALVAVFATQANAGTPVDPATLTPEPPPGAICSASGPTLVLCHTIFVEDLVNEPVFSLPCGQVYETSHDPRVGLRRYEDGLLVRRHVFSDLEGVWSLSPSGDGPIVRIEGHLNWIDTYLVPGDESSASTTFQGLGLRAFVPGGVVQIAGLERPDEDPAGVFRFPEDPAAAEALCAALGEPL
jgi:hypothetical protein